MTRGHTGPSATPPSLRAGGNQRGQLCVTLSLLHAPQQSQLLNPSSAGPSPKPLPLQIIITEPSSPCRAVPGVPTPCSLPGPAGSSIPEESLGRIQPGQVPHPPPVPSLVPVPAPPRAQGHTREAVPSPDIQLLPGSYETLPVKAPGLRCEEIPWADSSS